ncbi:MAG: methylmalonyl-CoA decarboxylase [Solirubrobacteraceae bacterium]|jgi:methylmalonyl-CoA decarboxylase
MSVTGTEPGSLTEDGEPASLIGFERQGRVGTITLRNERRRNALCKQMLAEMREVLDEFAHQQVRAVVLRAGPDVKVWSAGHDIRELPRDGSDPMRYADPLEQALRAIRKHPAPVIAMIHGSVWGLATDLTLSCDFIVADRTAQFAITAVDLGLPYNASGIQNFIMRVGAHIARQMFFTSEPLPADAALQHGIINYLVDESELERYTYDLAERLAKKSPLAISVIKEQIRILAEAHPVSATTFERIEGLRNRVYDSDDYQEGIRAFLEKRPASFRGPAPGDPAPSDHY